MESSAVVIFITVSIVFLPFIHLVCIFFSDLIHDIQRRLMEEIASMWTTPWSLVPKK